MPHVRKLLLSTRIGKSSKCRGQARKRNKEKDTKDSWDKVKIALRNESRNLGRKKTSKRKVRNTWLRTVKEMDEVVKEEDVECHQVRGEKLRVDSCKWMKAGDRTPQLSCAATRDYPVLFQIPSALKVAAMSAIVCDGLYVLWEVAAKGHQEITWVPFFPLPALLLFFLLLWLKLCRGGDWHLLWEWWGGVWRCGAASLRQGCLCLWNERQQNFRWEAFAKQQGLHFLWYQPPFKATCTASLELLEISFVLLGDTILWVSLWTGTQKNEPWFLLLPQICMIQGNTYDLSVSQAHICTMGWHPFHYHRFIDS